MIKEYRTISEYQIIYTMPETILTAPFSKKTASTIPHRNINTIPPALSSGVGGILIEILF